VTRPSVLWRALPAALVAACLLGVVAETAAAAGPNCAQAVVKDWASGGLNRSYPLRCYRQALAALPEDVRTYSSAPDDIRHALDARLASQSKAVRKVAAVEEARATSPERRDEDGNAIPTPLLLAGSLALVLAGLSGAGTLLHRRLRR
jgi:hypothetical protein